jgi:hypothetical protein
MVNSACSSSCIDSPYAILSAELLLVARLIIAGYRAREVVAYQPAKASVGPRSAVEGVRPDL